MMRERLVDRPGCCPMKPDLRRTRKSKIKSKIKSKKISLLAEFRERKHEFRLWGNFPMKPEFGTNKRLRFRTLDPMENM
jgi:hypothetical protein